VLSPPGCGWRTPPRPWPDRRVYAPAEEMRARPVDAVRTPSPMLQVRHADDPRPFLVMPSRADREALFDRWSTSGDEYLSPAEVDRAIDELWPQLNHRKVVSLAYRAADTAGDKLIDRRAFKRLLQHAVYLNDRFAVLENINKRTEGRITSAEFRKALPLLGITVRPTEANGAFAAIDEDGAGFILFEELCEWAARRHAHASVGTRSSPPRQSRSRSPSPTRRVVAKTRTSRSRSRSGSPLRSRSPRRSRSRSPSRPESPRVHHHASGLRLDPVQVTLVGGETVEELTAEALREQRRQRRLNGRRRAQQAAAAGRHGGTPLLGSSSSHERTLSGGSWSRGSSSASFSSSSSSDIDSDGEEESFLYFQDAEQGQVPHRGRTRRRSRSRSPRDSAVAAGPSLSRAAAAQARREARRSHPSTQWRGADFSDWPPSGRLDAATPSIGGPAAARGLLEPCARCEKRPRFSKLFPYHSYVKFLSIEKR
jgi:hypothetical protein